MHFAVHITLLVTVPHTVIVPCLLFSFFKKKKGNTLQELQSSFSMYTCIMLIMLIELITLTFQSSPVSKLYWHPLCCIRCLYIYKQKYIYTCIFLPLSGPVLIAHHSTGIFNSFVLPLEDYYIPHLRTLSL